MQYSLQALNKNSILDNFRLTDIIETLNLIGFEVDEIFEEKNNIIFVLKIPANREDLLSEEYFLKELIHLFSLSPFSLWKSIKKKYFGTLKYTYTNYKNIPNFEVTSSLKNILMYNIEIDNFKNFISPIWLQEKIQDFGYESQKNILDLTTLMNIEWGQSIQLYSSNQEKIGFELTQLDKDKNIIDSKGNMILIPKNSIVVKNDSQEIINCLGYPFPSFFIQNEKLLCQAIFYDIDQNLLELNSINTKLSFRYLRKFFLSSFRISFQRFLSLLLILTKEENISIKKYSFGNMLKELKKEKIIKLKKKSSSTFLNLKEYNEGIFQKIGIPVVCKTSTDFYFQIPENRKDLVREIDLIEEYSRFIGYKNFSEIKPRKENIISTSKEKRYTFLTKFFISFGFYEIITSSIDENKKERKKSILLTNPLNNDFFLLRSELTSKIFQIFQLNFTTQGIITNFFEIGRIFKKVENNIIEEDHFCTIFQSFFEEKRIGEKDSSLDFFKNKGFIENFLFFFGYKDVEFEVLKNQNNYYHPRRSFLIKKDGIILGLFGEIHPSLNEFKKPVYFLELNTTYFKDGYLKSKINIVKEISKYPSIIKDLSFTISSNVSFVDIKTSLLNQIQNLKSFSFFDIYFSSSLPKVASLLKHGNLKIGIRLEFQSFVETLTSLQIENELQKVKKILQNEFQVNFFD
jgi:phenylalanyl-tRNA synthetase beta chain